MFLAPGDSWPPFMMAGANPYCAKRREAHPTQKSGAAGAGLVRPRRFGGRPVRGQRHNVAGLPATRPRGVGDRAQPGLCRRHAGTPSRPLRRVRQRRVVEAVGAAERWPVMLIRKTWVTPLALASRRRVARQWSTAPSLASRWQCASIMLASLLWLKIATSTDFSRRSRILSPG